MANSPSRENTFNCSSKRNVIFTNLVFTREIARMSSLEKGNLFLGVSELLNVPSDSVSLRVLDASDVNGVRLWIQLVKFYDPKLLSRATILSVPSGCGSEDENEEERVDSVSHLTDTLKQFISSCQDGLSVDGRVEHLLRCGAWFLSRAGLVISCSEDPIETMDPSTEHGHRRVRRQIVSEVVNEELVEGKVTSVRTNSIVLENTKVGTGLTSSTSFIRAPVSTDVSLESMWSAVDTRSVESQIQTPAAVVLPEYYRSQMFSLDQTLFDWPLTRVVPSSEPTHVIRPTSSSFPTPSYFYPPQLTPVSSLLPQPHVPIIYVLPLAMEESVMVMTNADEISLMDFSDIEMTTTPSPTTFSPLYTIFIPSLIDDLYSTSLPSSTPSSSDLLDIMSTFVFMDESSSKAALYVTPPTSIEVVETSPLFDSSIPSLSMKLSLFTSDIPLMSTSNIFVFPMLTSFLDVPSLMESVSLLQPASSSQPIPRTPEFTPLSSLPVLETLHPFTVIVTPMLMATPLATHSSVVTEALVSSDVSSPQIEMSEEVLLETSSFFSITRSLSTYLPDFTSSTDLLNPTRTRQEGSVKFMASATTVVGETSSEIFMPLTTGIAPDFTSVMLEASSIVVLDTPSAIATYILTSIMTDSVFLTRSIDTLLSSVASAFIPVMQTSTFEISIADDSVSIFMSDVISLTNILDPTRTREEDTVAFMLPASSVRVDQTISEIFVPLTADFPPEFTALIGDDSSIVVEKNTLSAMATDIVFLTSSVDILMSSSVSAFIPVMTTSASTISISDNGLGIMSDIVSPSELLETTKTRKEDTVTFVLPDTSIIDDGTISEIFVPLTTYFLPEFTYDGLSISMTDIPEPTRTRQEDTMTFMLPVTSAIVEETMSDILTPLTTDISPESTSVMEDITFDIIVDTSIAIVTDAVILTTSVDALQSNSVSDVFLVMTTSTSMISVSDDGLSIMSDIVSPSKILEPTRTREEDAVTSMLPATSVLVDQMITDIFVPLTTDFPPEFTSVMVDDSSLVVEDTLSAMVTNSIFLTNFIDALLSSTVSESAFSISDDGMSIFRSDVVSPTDIMAPTRMREEVTPLVATITVDETNSEIFLPLTVDFSPEFMSLMDSSLVVEDTFFAMVTDSVFLTSSFDVLLSSGTSDMPTSTPISGDSLSILMSDFVAVTDILEPTRTMEEDTVTFMLPDTSVIVDETSSEIFLPISTDFLPEFTSVMVDASFIDIEDSSSAMVTDSIFFISSIDALLSSVIPDFNPVIPTSSFGIFISDDGLSTFMSDVISLTDILEPTRTRKDDTMTFMPPATSAMVDKSSPDIFLPLTTDVSPEYMSVMEDISSVITVDTLSAMGTDDSIFITSSVDAFLSKAVSASVPHALTIIIEPTPTVVPDSSEFKPTPTDIILVPDSSNVVLEHIPTTNTIFRTDSSKLDPSPTTSFMLVPESSIISPLPPSPVPSPALPLCEFIDCNNGSCRNISDDFYCDCFLGWEGDFCENNINFCESHPCDPLLSVACVDGNSSYTCNCQVGYTGQNCSIDINECDPNLCINGATCLNLVGGFTCTCQTGFTGRLCEVVDPCEPEPCLNGGSCNVLGRGEFICNCPPGLTGYRCGYPVDPCSSLPCANNAICETVFLDYGLAVKCTCHPGFEGNFCENVIDACVSQPCLNGGNCSSLSLVLFNCACPVGFVGAMCEEVDDICVPNPCSNNGSCSLDIDGIVNCRCLVGYEGLHCENRIDPCASRPCVNNASCLLSASAGGFECLCLQGYSGLICENAINPCENSPCFNKGTCLEVTFDSFTCVCMEYYTGMLCNIPINLCDSTPCMNHGTCERLSSEGFTCSCTEDYTGSLCDIPVDPCNSTPCMNHGTCERLSFENFTCFCTEDYTGMVCDLEIDPCSSDPCQNNGRCMAYNAREYICTCVSRYSGVRCEIPPSNRPPVVLNPVETLFAIEGRLFQSTLPTPIFYDPDTGDSSLLTLMLLQSNNPLPNTTWIQLTSDGGSLEAIPTSDQLSREGEITEHTFILRAIDAEGDSGETFVLIRIFPQNPPILNLLTIFLDGDFISFGQRLSDRLLLVSLLASFGNREGGASESDFIYLSRFQNGIAITYSNVSIPNSNCGNFKEWVSTVYSVETLQYTQSFSDAVRPFTLIKTPFIEGPCNVSSTNTLPPDTIGTVIITNSPHLLLAIAVPTTLLSLLGLIFGLACFILYRRKRPERRELTTRTMRSTFLNRRPVILPGELSLPVRQGYPTILPGEVFVNPRRMGWRGVTRGEEEERACMLVLEEEVGDEEDGEESADCDPVPSSLQRMVELDTFDDPPPEYSLPPLYSYARAHQTGCDDLIFKC